jgi:hypothetical protein
MVYFWIDISSRLGLFIEKAAIIEFIEWLDGHSWHQSSFINLSNLHMSVIMSRISVAGGWLVVMTDDLAATFFFFKIFNLFDVVQRRSTKKFNYHH